MSTLYTVYQQSNGITGINVSTSEEDSDNWLRARGGKLTFTAIYRTTDMSAALARLSQEQEKGK
jgi:hypothetical protein